jgi:hypothetical protein
MSIITTEHYCTKEETIIVMKETIKNLTEWQKKQNGTLIRIEEKVDKLVWWILGTFATFSLGIISTVVYVVFKFK